MVNIIKASGEIVQFEEGKPKMCDFYRDHDGNWWFKTVGKGNKERQIAVSNAMLNTLKQYRKSADLASMCEMMRVIAQAQQLTNILMWNLENVIDRLKINRF